MPFAIAILIIAAIWNWHAGVVPNALPLLLLFLFIPFAWITQLPLEEIGFRIALGVATLVFAFVLFAFDHIGGGTAKLIVATTLWLSWPVAGVYVLICLAIGICLHYALDKTDVQIVELMSEQHAAIAACLGIILIVATHLSRSGH